MVSMEKPGKNNQKEYNMKAPLQDKLFHVLSLRNRFTNFSYSQEGEDMILNRIFERQQSGTYVDVGAHHPFRFSNTYFFYKKGWRGINIDPMPGIMRLFNKYRKGDINIETGVAGEKGTLTYHMFAEGALNTFDEKTAQGYISSGQKLVSKKNVAVAPLAEILDTYLSPGRMIDFLTIDAEGLDTIILRSNNWDKYKPKVILVESHTVMIEEFTGSEIYTLMKAIGYRLVAKTYYTYFFMYA